MPHLSNPLGQFCNRLLSLLERTFLSLTQPAHPTLALSIASDLLRNKSHLVAETALLRQQRIPLRVHLCWLLSPRVLMNAVKSYHSPAKHLDSWFG